ncbi:hypothetical protein DSO57_1011127 [Entomophthora muscae]|uniref:Uncharacterized protein n=1 Tax=Entomophthora muscae TaxID=34485 RepID=A0ACC2U5E9_9FUNG|nr:hypothetical protein DSO57_1011127 [Entomophthora muscae]
MVPPVYWMTCEPFGESFDDLLGALIPQEGVIEDVATLCEQKHTENDKNTSKQPKETKRSSKPTKATKKKPVSSIKATLKPSPKPSPEPSPEKSPAHSTGGEETDDSFTDHSFYNLASDKEPIKKQCQAKKTPPKDKSPAHEEHHNKPPSASHHHQTPPFKLIWG